MTPRVLNATSLTQAPSSIAARRAPRPRQAAPTAAAADAVSSTVPTRLALAQAVDMLSDAVLFLDAAMRIVEVNSAALGGSGYPASELHGKHLDKLFRGDDQGQWQAGLARLQRRESWSETLPAVQLCRDGDAFAVHVQLRWVDEAAQPMLVAVVHDRSDRDLEALAARVGTRDHLTRLATRGVLEARLQRVGRRARRRRTRFAVLFVDVDRFKLVNDTRGHRTGDLVLAAIGKRLRACMRPGDFLARYGGDEFVALLEDVGTDAEVERIASRVRAELRLPIPLADGTLSVSASVGVAIGRPTSSVEAIFEQADRAMYRDKSRR
jgi:diguanylate cyclase (GGDEF)-like protein/PAS domain S-box-containing protein